MKKTLMAAILVALLAAPIANAATPAAKITKPKATAAEGTAGHEMSESSGTQAKEGAKVAPKKATAKKPVAKAKK